MLKATATPPWWTPSTTPKRNPRNRSSKNVASALPSMPRHALRRNGSYGQRCAPRLSLTMARSTTLLGTNTIMFKILSLCALLALCFSTANALFEEDAGQLDFLVASTGHGHTAFGQGSTAAVISSDSTAEPWVPSAQETSCYVASRSVDTGSLLWRRNVCAADSDNKSHVTVVSAGHVITTDLSGIVRGWEIETGNLVWDTLVPTSKKNPPALWIVTKDSQDFVAVVGSEFALLEAATGTAVESPTKGEAQSSKPASIKATEAFCSSAELLVTVDTTDNSLHAFRSDKGKAGDALQLTTDFELEDAATGLFLLSCEANAASILVASSRGTTTHLTLTVDGPNVHAVTTWTAQEGLGQISSALMLDASHYVGELTEAKEEKLLEFSARLESQWKSLTSIFSPQSGTGRRDHAFGFVKIAVLLSQSSHRVFGMDTAGTARAEIRYQVDLPEDAEWHKMVHGTANSQQSMHGIHGGTHTREVLILSSVPSGNGKEIHWTCLDGTNGDIHAQGSVAVSSSVAQIAPLVGAGSCRQSAVLVLQDRSLAVIPGDDATNASVKAQIEATPNGFYSHVIDKKNSGLESLRIAMTGDELVAQPVGFASFPGEEIVTVAYPSREEVVESSCNVLGDDSILLKYLNPHLAVLVTMSTAGSELDKFSSALKRSKAGSQKRKPAGVKQGDVAPPSDDAPNLFVNVVDSVSGRVLYRASHANAISTIAPIALVSENWVFYTFMNEKTRRAEIGVLSLYEGMIGSDALTAFSTPEQIETFSSLDARESKPVVLAKTYAISKPATALGMTSTLGGISNRRLLIAGIDNRITAVERKLLEPRRPLGEVKDIEKREGLHQYSELIPSVSYAALSYNKVVESAKTILSAPTDLESQSLVLAFGGPDIFFTRTSPSRGFDLLPESFNRVLLSIVVLALMVVLVVVKQMGAKKMRKQGWA